MSNKRRFTEDEDNFIRVHYHNTKASEIGKLLNRSKEVIIWRAGNLGLKKKTGPPPKDGWENIFIRLAYPEFSARIIAEHIGCTEKVVYHAAQKLGLKVYKHIRAGDKFKNLTVIEKIYKKGEVNKWTYWKCVCECGREKIISNGSLTRGTQSCGNCITNNKIYSNKFKEFPALGTYYSRVKQSAKNRKIEFEVDIEYIWKLLKEQNFTCKLSGLKIKLVGSKYKNHQKLTTASLDRIDSSKGYIQGNLQWVHKDVNFMKQEYNQEYFLEICYLIYKTTGNKYET